MLRHCRRRALIPRPGHLPPQAPPRGQIGPRGADECPDPSEFRGAERCRSYRLVLRRNCEVSVAGHPPKAPRQSRHAHSARPQPRLPRPRRLQVEVVEPARAPSRARHPGRAAACATCRRRFGVLGRGPGRHTGPGTWLARARACRTGPDRSNLPWPGPTWPRISHGDIHAAAARVPQCSLRRAQPAGSRPGGGHGTAGPALGQRPLEPGGPDSDVLRSPE
jgi:hypothetical protein